MSSGGTQGQQTKKVGEDVRLSFDFTSALTATESILTAAVVATVYSGVDPTPSAIISGVAFPGTRIVTQLIVDGVVGCIYQLTCTITVSTGQTLQISSYLAVVPDLV